MEHLDDLNMVEKRTLTAVNQLLQSIRAMVGADATELPAGIGVLKTLRQSAYEELNQIQHEAMIVRAAQFLMTHEPAKEDIDWYWNPRQTGSADEPDLREITNGRIVVSAEITASERPVGSIDTRMADTLQKLSVMPGRKFYFVRTDVMEKRAATKVSKGRYDIEVRLV